MKTTALNILLADDDSDDRLFFKEVLKEISLATNLTTVANGEQLMLLLTNENYELPDVLFLDLNMPRKNGFECLTEIKQIERLKTIPVVIFSTSFEQEVVNLLYKNGAQYFVRKPSEFTQLKEIVEITVELFLHKEIEKPTEDKFVLTLENKSPE